MNGLRTRTPDLLRVGALVAFCALAYLPSLGVPFVFDDLPNLVLNEAVHPHSLSDLPASLHARGRQDRPVAMFTFALNYLWSGLDTTSYHVVNIAIHAANAVILFFLLRLLAVAGGSPPSLKPNASAFAFAGALVWAVHPVNTQAVTYIVQRMASLAALFYLAGMLLFVLWRSGRISGRWCIVGIAGAFLAGFLSKANVVTLPVALLLIDVVFFGGFRRAHRWAIGIIGVAAVIMGALYAPGALEHLFTAPAHRDFSGVERLMTEGRVIWHYLSLIAWPDANRLQVDYDFAVSRSLLDPSTTLPALAALVTLTALALAALRRWPWPAFGWLFFMVALSVESSIILLELAFEHRLYLPTTMLLPGVLAPVFSLAGSGRRLASVSVAVMLVAGALTLQTIERNAQWADLGGLWSADLQRGASPFRAALNGAIAMAQQGRPREALTLLEHVPRGDLDRSEAARLMETRGETLFMLGRYEEALEEFRGAVRLYPAWTRAAYSAAQCLFQLGRIEDATKLEQQLRSSVPDSVFTAVLSSALARERKDYRRAADILRDFLAQHPDGEIPRLNLARMHLANVYRALGRPAAAADQYRAIVHADPKHWGAWSSLYHMLEAGGDEQRAARIAAYLGEHGVDPDGWASTTSGSAAPMRMREQ